MFNETLKLRSRLVEALKALAVLVLSIAIELLTALEEGAGVVKRAFGGR